MDRLLARLVNGSWLIVILNRVQHDNSVVHGFFGEEGVAGWLGRVSEVEVEPFDTFDLLSAGGAQDDVSVDVG